MKQLILLPICWILLLLPAHSATVSGNAMNVWSGLNTAGIVVTVADSLGAFTLTSTTNSSGNFSVTVPSSYTSGRIIVTAPTNCLGVSYRYSSSYTGGNIVTPRIDDCANGPSNRLMVTTTLGVDAVYLIRKDLDPSTGAYLLTLIDSLLGSYALGGSTQFHKDYPGGIPSGTLLVKAVMHSGSPNYSSYLPTYYSSSSNWSNATALTSADFYTYGGPVVGISINMIVGTNPGGPGFIGGSVLIGANKGTGIGDPLSNRIIILTSQTSGKVVAHTFSNASGAFSFSNIPYDTYVLSGDAGGKANPPFNVTLSPTQPSITNITFEENDTRFFGHFGGLSVAGPVKGLNSLFVYPNPVKNFVQVQGIKEVPGSKQITLTDMVGRNILTENVGPGVECSLSTKDLTSGIYNILLHTETGNISFKIVK